MLGVSIHRELPWIRLPLSGALPKDPAALTAPERGALEGLLNQSRNLGNQLLLAPRQAHLGAAMDEATVRQGWQRFFRSHFAFFYDLALLGESYRELTRAVAEEDLPQLRLAVDRTCILWRAAGALMLYGVDFSPTEEIYKCHIRSHMPPGLSGTWLREYIVCNRWKRLWQERQEREVAGQEISDLKARLRHAEKSYHLQHRQVMHACVPEMVSLLQDYVTSHGQLEPTEGNFQTYDGWFHVDRVERIDLACYIQTGCDLFTTIIEDILSVTALQEETLRFLEQGFGVMLDLLLGLLAKSPPLEAAGTEVATAPGFDRPVAKPLLDHT